MRCKLEQLAKDRRQRTPFFFGLDSCHGLIPFMRLNWTPRDEVEPCFQLTSVVTPQAHQHLSNRCAVYVPQEHAGDGVIGAAANKFRPLTVPGHSSTGHHSSKSLKREDLSCGHPGASRKSLASCSDPRLCTRLLCSSLPSCPPEPRSTPCLCRPTLQQLWATSSLASTAGVKPWQQSGRAGASARAL